MKKATPAFRHWSRTERNQPSRDGRAPGPLSPPTMSQSSTGPQTPTSGSVIRYGSKSTSPSAGS
jgi:hypothetical protein